MMISFLRKKHIVEYHELNPKGNLKEFEIGNLIQQAAGEHAALLHRGYDDLKKQGKAWMMTRADYYIYAYPKAADTIYIETWVDNFDKLYSHRDNHIFDVNDNVIIVVRTVWMVVNIEKRKIESVVPYVDLFPTIPNKCGELAQVDRIKPFTNEPKHVSKQKVTYSALDIIGHTNNTRYIEWFVDGMPHNWHTDKNIEQLTVNYLHETKLDDELHFYYDWRINENGDSIILYCNVHSDNNNTCIATFRAKLRS